MLSEQIWAEVSTTGQCRATILEEMEIETPRKCIRETPKEILLDSQPLIQPDYGFDKNQIPQS